MIDNKSRLEELKEERADIKQSIKDILEGGQEFQTRNGRVKQVNLQTLYNRLAIVEAQINEFSGDYTDVERLVFRGCR